jgi:cell wall-associated NlpC family hydrolase
MNFMIKTLLPALVIVAVLTSCSSLQPISMGTNKAAPVEVKRQSSKEVKFLDDISVSAEPSSPSEREIAKKKEPSVNITKESTPSYKPAARSSVSALHMKYASLLNVDPELLTDNPWLKTIDEWYGTRYRYGGTTKAGIDCSAFVQVMYLSALGMTLPRTARDQYKYSRIISATELKEGDLVFFNTRGGVSHVGIYLQNNKFVHASTSNGVTISDMFDPYYMKHFIGAGRIERNETTTAANRYSNSSNN